MEEKDYRLVLIGNTQVGLRGGKGMTIKKVVLNLSPEETLRLQNSRRED
jgi:hypothetical protein